MTRRAARDDGPMIDFGFAAAQVELAIDDSTGASERADSPVAALLR